MWGVSLTYWYLCPSISKALNDRMGMDYGMGVGGCKCWVRLGWRIEVWSVGDNADASRLFLLCLGMAPPLCPSAARGLGDTVHVAGEWVVWPSSGADA